MDSDPMRQARSKMFGNDPNSFCSKCYKEESISTTSRRHRSNQKSVIFTRSNFHESYQQSPGLGKFEYSRVNSGRYDGMPIDLHIDLGNYCNLTCKMCGPRASSKIAAQYVKWGIDSARPYLGTDWTRDSEVWDRVLNELSGIKNLRNVHFMGGETLLTRRFGEFVDFMLDAGRTDLSFSFVTNGTVFDSELMSRLRKFQRVGIEVSIETMTAHNEYQRQGTDNQIILKNINQYLKICDGRRITLTVRPAISLLTIGNYHTLLDFCLQNNIIVKSSLCTAPRYLDPSMLPSDIKHLYTQRYLHFMQDHDLESVEIDHDYNESGINQTRKIVKNQVLQIINFLKTPDPDDADHQWSQLVSWCQRWDQVHGFDARKLYPEFKELLEYHGYQV